MSTSKSKKVNQVPKTLKNNFLLQTPSHDSNQQNLVNNESNNITGTEALTEIAKDILNKEMKQ